MRMLLLCLLVADCAVQGADMGQTIEKAGPTVANPINSSNAVSGKPANTDAAPMGPDN